MNATTAPLEEPTTTDSDPRPEEIPQAPDGFVRLRSSPTSQEIWIQPQSITPARTRHAPFTGEWRDRILEVQETLAGVHPLSYQEWEEDFRRDMRPYSEILTWLAVARTFRHYAGRLDKETRQELFDLLLASTIYSPGELKGYAEDQDISCEVMTMVLQRFRDELKAITLPVRQRRRRRPGKNLDARTSG